MPSLYARLFLPRLIDAACSSMREQRAQVVPLARGRVLEIGFGSGLNLPFYDAMQVRHVTGLEPATRLQALAAQRVVHSQIPVELLTAPAEHIPRADASFDSVVSTFTLCSVNDPMRALQELRRVLVPGGQLLFCEHGLAPEPQVQRWQKRLQPVWKMFSGGCHLTRDVPGLLIASGFVLAPFTQAYTSGRRWVSYTSWGAAQVAFIP